MNLKEIREANPHITYLRSNKMNANDGFAIASVIVLVAVVAYKYLTF